MLFTGLKESIILGLLQGITEFLPVSSSGHLVLFQHLFGLKEPELFFDTFLHMGTMLATILFFRQEIKNLFNLKALTGNEGNNITNITISLIPTIAIGLLIDSRFGYVFASLAVVRVSFLITALALLVPLITGRVAGNAISRRKAFIVGIAQGIAVVPGISRSGSTIVTGIASGIDVTRAFTFSFLISIPAIAGAMGLNIMKGSMTATFSISSMLLGFFVSFVSGYISLMILKKAVTSMKLHFFSIYLVILFASSFMIR